MLQSCFELPAKTGCKAQQPFTSLYSHQLDKALDEVMRDPLTAMLDGVDALAARLARIIPQLPATYQPGDYARHLGWHQPPGEKSVTAKIIELYQGEDTPLHDHPGTSGILIVLQGGMDSHQFDTGTCDPNNTALVELLPQRSKSVQAGSFITYTPMCGNIHTMRAQHAGCVLLEISFGSGAEHIHNWYMPLTSIHNRQPVRARRIPVFDDSARMCG